MLRRDALSCAWIGAGLLVLILRASAEDDKPKSLEALSFRGQRFVTREVDPMHQDLRLFWTAAAGNVLGNFTALKNQVTALHEVLIFAANAGMFDQASKPIGLLVEDGREIFPINLSDGYGNFFMKPNGVFLINQHRHALLVKSEDYAALEPPALWATQSGPILVEGGNINPDFQSASKNLKMRSGVGVTTTGQIVFALSQQPVTFYDFAALFVERLHCPDALYLDGEISAFWTPGISEREGQHHFGPMIGVVDEAPREGVTASPAAP